MKPKCPFDGLPCEHYGNCEVSTFGTVGDEILWRCPRLVVKIRKN